MPSQSHPSPAVRTRLAGEDDAPFLLELYAITRAAELQVFGWPPEQQRLFLKMQYQARAASYRTSFPGAEDHLVLSDDGTPLGRLLVDRTPPEIKLVDIALVPAARGRGVGGELVRRLCAEADASRRRVVLHVAEGNPAARLYERHGFRVSRAEPPYLEMVRIPGAGAAVPSSSV